MYIRVFVLTKVGTALPCSKVFTPKTVWPPKSSAKVSGVEEASQPAAGSIHGIASAALLPCSDFFIAIQRMTMEPGGTALKMNCH